MKQRLIATWTRNFYSAFAVLFGLKLTLAGNNIFGTEGFESGYKIFSKLPLLIGNDIFGAAMLAALISIACIPWLKRGDGGRGVLITSMVLQIPHALLAAVSFFATIYVGGPLNKEVIELADGGAASVAGEAPAIWSSVSHYLGAGQISCILGAVLIAAGVYRFFPRLAKGLGARIKLLINAALVVEFALGVLLLPWLINGHLWGIRIHTFGLERSAGIEMGWSYVKPAFSWMRGKSAEIEDEFVFDLSSIVGGKSDRLEPLLAGATRKKTNVIVISLESVASTYIREDPSRMPFLAGTADRDGAIHMGNHYTVWPQTMKAFFSLFCSELPYPTYRSIALVNPTIRCESISEVLHRDGYYTALITSADLAYDRKKRFFQHRDFDMFMDMRDMPGREDVWGNSWGLDERLAVKRILELASKKRDERFFVFYEMFTAHHPYYACVEHEDNPLDEFPSYVRALRYIDDRIRDIVEGIDKLGLSQETLVAIVSDHGEGFGQHPGSRGHGAKVYQENVHVPFAMIGPQLAGVRGEATFPTSHIDVAPTILGLLGLDIPCTMKGRDLSSSRKPVAVLFGGRPPGAQKGLVDGKWKYIVEDNGMELLFDLWADPGEKKSLIVENKELAGKFGKMLDDWSVFSENLIENYSEIRKRSSCAPR